MEFSLFYKSGRWAIWNLIFYLGLVLEINYKLAIFGVSKSIISKRNENN